MNLKDKQKPVEGAKVLLTPAEKSVYTALKKHADGYLRGYGDSLLRLQDSKINPVANFARSTIKKLIEKNWIRLLPDNKFEIL